MNDTMKLALGVTGFASLLVLAVPSNFEVSQEEPQQQPPAPTTQKQIAAKPKTQTIIEEDDDDEEEGFAFGDPTVSTDPIDFDDFDKNESNQTNSIVKAKAVVENKVKTQPNQSFGSPAGPVLAAEGQPLSSPISRGAPKPLPPQAPKKTVGTGGKPINSTGISISDSQ